MFPSERQEERKKRETQEVILQGEHHSRCEEGKRIKSVIQRRVGGKGGCLRAVIEMSRQSKQDGGERRAD